MFNKHLSRQRSKEPHQLEITPFLNLMVALVPFLLVTAVFSRVAILELNLPSTQQVEAADEDKQIIEIIVREDKLELSDGLKVLSSYEKSDDGYDLDGLSKALIKMKEQFPDKTDASILLERKIQFAQVVIDHCHVVVQEKSLVGPLLEFREDLSRLRLPTQSGIGTSEEAQYHGTSSHGRDAVLEVTHGLLIVALREGDEPHHPMGGPKRRIDLQRTCSRLVCLCEPTTPKHVCKSDQDVDER